MKLPVRATVVALLVVVAGCSTLASPPASPAATDTATSTATATATPTATPTVTDRAQDGDADGDGLTNARERQLGTSPYSPDTDGDGIEDAREIKLGLDPASEDTDGDNLGDQWELENETADPKRMDLFLTIVRGEDVPPLTGTEREDIVRTFDQMNVTNHDNSSGIDVHLRTRAEELPTYNGEDFNAFTEEYDSGPPRHTMLFVRFDDSLNYSGESIVGEIFSLVAGQHTADSNGLTWRTETTIHEILHGIVGRYTNGETHVESGWLKHGSGSDHFLNPRTAQHIEEHGFD